MAECSVQDQGFTRESHQVIEGVVWVGLENGSYQLALLTVVLDVAHIALDLLQVLLCILALLYLGL